MTKKEIAIKFEAFLVENNSYTKFKNNLEKAKCNWTIEDILNSVAPEAIINFAFDWNDTPEGFDYWSNRDDEWTDIISLQYYNILELSIKEMLIWELLVAYLRTVQRSLLDSQILDKIIDKREYVNTELVKVSVDFTRVNRDINMFDIGYYHKLNKVFDDDVIQDIASLLNKIKTFAKQ